MTKFEQRVQAMHEKDGWKSLRNGWPDFLFYRQSESGELELLAVEAKGKGDQFRGNQERMLALLSTVMKVREVREGCGFGDYLNRHDVHALVYDIERFERFSGDKL